MGAGIKPEAPAGDLHWKNAVPVVNIKSHTALRGIAALLVVLLPYSQILRPVFDVDSYTSFVAKGYLWVDFFFILSGYVLSHVYSASPGNDLTSTWRFLRMRFARIYPLHFMTLLCLVALQITVPIIFHRDLATGGWSTLPYNLLNVHA
jgi:peptidoglycan/LPS O-acetylase OafA/YrhL